MLRESTFSVLGLRRSCECSNKSGLRTKWATWKRCKKGGFDAILKRFKISGYTSGFSRRSWRVGYHWIRQKGVMMDGSGQIAIKNEERNFSTFSSASYMQIEIRPFSIGTSLLLAITQPLVLRLLCMGLIQFNQCQGHSFFNTFLQLEEAQSPKPRLVMAPIDIL